MLINSKESKLVILATVTLAGAIAVGESSMISVGVPNLYEVTPEPYGKYTFILVPVAVTLVMLGQSLKSISSVKLEQFVIFNVVNAGMLSNTNMLIALPPAGVYVLSNEEHPEKFNPSIAGKYSNKL
jgi:hypothetical protein